MAEARAALATPQNCASSVRVVRLAAQHCGIARRLDPTVGGPVEQDCQSRSVEPVFGRSVKTSDAYPSIASAWIAGNASQ
jgi:hypothetical protein